MNLHSSTCIVLAFGGRGSDLIQCWQRFVDSALLFICTHSGMEGSSPLYFAKEEIDRAAKDKSHKVFPANLAMQVHFVELPAMQKRVIYHEDVFDTGALRWHHDHDLILTAYTLLQSRDHEAQKCCQLVTAVVRFLSTRAHLRSCNHVS
jgi:hypothetical protein